MIALLITCAVLLFMLLIACVGVFSALLEIGERIDALFSDVIDEEAEWYLFDESGEP